MPELRPAQASPEPSLCSGEGRGRRGRVRVSERVGVPPFVGPLVNLVAEAISRGAHQRASELVWLVELLEKREPPRRVLEIGSEYGGTLWLWCQLATEDARVMSIDRPVDDIESGSLRLDPTRAQQVLAYVRMDSRDPRTPREARDFFAGEPVDLLFVDGGHSRECVEHDWLTYGPLVGEGGIVAFHDIDGDDSNGVKRLWNDTIRFAHTTDQFVDPESPGMGIGLVLL